MNRISKLSPFGGIVILGGMMAAGLGLATPGAAQPDRGPALGEVIRQAMDADGPMLTDAEKALIAERCGYADGEWNGSTFMAREGVLICTNGRRVDDPEVRALMSRVGERARARVEAVMRRPEVRRAMSGEIQREVDAEMRRFREEMQPKIRRAVAEAQASAQRAAVVHRRLSEEDRGRIAAEVERAMRQVEAIDFSAIEREIEQSMERSFGERRRRDRSD